MRIVLLETKRLCLIPLGALRSIWSTTTPFARTYHPCASPSCRSSPRKNNPALAVVILSLALPVLAGCGSEEPVATVHGTVKRNGKPLDNCLVTFLPDGPQGEETRVHSNGLTDGQGKYELRRDDQRPGTSLGAHRVVVQDLSVSTGVQRRDHGTVDMEESGPDPPRKPQRSRVPGKYTSATSTPLRFEIKPGDQMIDVEIK